MKPAIWEHCDAFDNISAVTGYMLVACTNLSSFAKIADEATFRVILAASIRPLVQLNIPRRILNPLEDKKVETGREKEMTQLKKALLPCHDTQALRQEADNSPTWLLLAMLHLKSNWYFFSKGMQIDSLFKPSSDYTPNSCQSCSPARSTTEAQTRKWLEGWQWTGQEASPKRRGHG